MRKILQFNHDYVIRELDFEEEKVHGACILDEDGRANIYIDSKEPEELQKKRMKHELLHYVRKDHYRVDQENVERECKLAESSCTIRYICDDYIEMDYQSAANE